MKKRYNHLIGNNEVGFLESYMNLDKYSDLFAYYFKIEQNISEESFKYIQSKIFSSSVSILVYIETNPQFRKNNIGNQLLKQFIEDSHGDIILICDIEQDFIIQWYETYGFETLNSSKNIHPLPIMIRTK